MLKVMKVSVIVPVYNVKNYLHLCIQIVINQSFSERESLLIDEVDYMQVSGILKALRKVKFPNNKMLLYNYKYMCRIRIYKY